VSPRRASIGQDFSDTSTLSSYLMASPWRTIPPFVLSCEPSSALPRMGGVHNSRLLARVQERIATRNYMTADRPPGSAISCRKESLDLSFERESSKAQVYNHEKIFSLYRSHLAIDSFSSVPPRRNSTPSFGRYNHCTSMSATSSISLHTLTS